MLRLIFNSNLKLNPEPKPSPKPQPIGNMPMVVLFTTCTACILFLLWRRADTLKSVISYRYVDLVIV